MGFEIVQAGDTAENVFLLYFVIKSLIQSLWENPETTPWLTNVPKIVQICKLLFFPLGAYLHRRLSVFAEPCKSSQSTLQ